MVKKKGTLVLVRHGESRFNTLNLFTGNIDVSLSSAGLKEAQRVGRHCKKFDYDVVFTSHLERAQETLLVIIAPQKKIGIFHHEISARHNTYLNLSERLKTEVLSVYVSSDLNERSYGILQGMNKTSANRTYGAGKVLAWRRSYKKCPPKGESLKDVYERVISYFERHIYPRMKRGETILVVAHGNTLRALVKYLEHISDENISSVDLPFAQPLVYTHDDDTFVRTEGLYTLERPLR